jgi:hypothetical protein
MSTYSFDDGPYHVDTGWRPQSQAFSLWIQQRDIPALDPTVFGDLFYGRPEQAIQEIAATLEVFGIRPPDSLLRDLRQDARMERSDPDVSVHYDPETGTASVQAEYGDRSDNDALDWGIRSPEEAAFDGSVQEVLMPRHFGEASGASGRLEQLVDRIRQWFQRDQDRGMGL